MFESVNRRTDGRTDECTDGRRLDWYTISSPLAFGSGELKNMFRLIFHEESIYEVSRVYLMPEYSCKIECPKFRKRAITQRISYDFFNFSSNISLIILYQLTQVLSF